MAIVDVDDVLLRERSFRVDETELGPSRGEKMLSSSEGSSFAGKGEVPLTSDIEDCDNQDLRREQEKSEIGTYLGRDLRR